MTRRSATTNGVHTNGDGPPPSTLAAQIVQGQTRHSTSQPAGEPPPFSELLNAILHDQNAAQETDVNVNAQLVSVVTQLGLTPLTLENPFAEWDSLVSQAIDSIAVIEKTVTRQPDVLLVQLVPDGPQLALSLLASLISLCGLPKCSDVAAVGLISRLITSLASSANFWRFAHILVEVLQESVDDGLVALESLSSPNVPLNIKLPPARSISKLWPNAGSSITMPPGSNSTITEAARAFYIVVEICQVLDLYSPWQREAQHRLLDLLPKFKLQTVRSGFWARTVQVLLHFPRNWQLVQELLQDALLVLPDAQLQTGLAQSLLETLQTCEVVAKDHLLPPLYAIAEAENWASLHQDLKIAVTTWLCRYESECLLPEQISAMRIALHQDDAMTDGDLRTAFQQLSFSQIRTGRRPRERKRRKTCTNVTLDSGAVKKRTEHLNSAGVAEGTDFSRYSPAAYLALQEDEKCEVWQSLVELADQDLPTTCQTVSQLIQLPNITKQNEREYCPCWLFKHAFNTATMRSLQHSRRRIWVDIAYKVCKAPLESLPESIKNPNRHFALEVVRNLSDRDVPHEQETLITAWGQIAMSCDEQELELVLLRLVDYLGHRNMLVCALAFSEIEMIAGHRRQTAKELFQPFWRSVAVAVVRDLLTRPQKIQQLCDLLGTDVETFLVITQRQVLPTLVLTRRRDILERVALARGMKESVRGICLQPTTNLASILSLLLMQPSADVEESAMACLIELDPSFKDLDLASLLRTDAGLVAVELLKHCGDQDVSEKSRAYRAFQTFANIVQASPGQRRHSAKSTRAVASFFESHILGILTHFSAVLEEASPSATNIEKMRCLKGIAELFTLSRGNVNVALPQIRASLQTGLEQPALCETAFAAWLTLIPLLQAEDIVSIVDETFVLIIHHWHALSPETQQRTHEMISQLVKTHNSILQENIMTLPSLVGIPVLSKFAAEFDRLKNQESPESHYKAFTKRLRVDGDAVVLQALVELVPYLEDNQDFVHNTAASEHPSSILSDLISALLDVTVRYSIQDSKAAQLCGKALGIIGSVDPNRVEASRRKRQLLVLSNFDDANETIDWVMALFEDVLVKSFKSVTNARDQGFLAYTMQELLQICNFGDLSALRPRNSQLPDAYHRWDRLPEYVRTTLTPFLNSRYRVTSNNQAKDANRKYPSFSSDASHGQWLRSLTIDLMHRAKGDNAKTIFPLLARTTKGHDLATARFVLPFVFLNVVVGGTVGEIRGLQEEILAVLTATAASASQQECIRLCSEAVFSVLDYFATWLRSKRKTLADLRAAAYKTGISPSDDEEEHSVAQIDTVENFLASIPADIIANQAVECRSYARALLHWEQYIRKERSLIPSGRLPARDELMYGRLQDIYSQIDEPDGLEGIAAHLALISEEQQAFNHAKSGRWTAAQAWYELQLAERPEELGLQQNVLRCLGETGQHVSLLKYANSFLGSPEIPDSAINVHLPVTAEAYWMTDDLSGLQKCLSLEPPKTLPDFNVGIGRTLVCAAKLADGSYFNQVSGLRKSITESLSMADTDSLFGCHDAMIRLHVLYELEALLTTDVMKAPSLLRQLDKRLIAVGSYVQDKQFVLGLRRAAMNIRQQEFKSSQMGALWLTSARLARQAKNISSAYNAVLKAYECGDRGAKLEEAKLLWHEGHQRKAIQSLQAAIDSGIFAEPDTDASVSTTPLTEVNGYRQEMLTAKALLTLAKWLDASGQSQSKDMTDRYQLAARRYQRWEKGHYYLGKHYSKLLSAQRALPKSKQSQSCLTGEMTKLVIDNSLRSIPFGTKYWHETIPRVLTLWLELGTDTQKKAAGEEQATFEKRMKNLQNCNKQLQKYFERVPPYVFYHTLPQLISRISHPHPDIWKQLCNILTRIASTYPSQALWSLLAVVKAKDQTRVERGMEILNKLRDPKNKPKGTDLSAVDLRTMIQQGQRLCDGLLAACEKPVEGRAVEVSLSRNLDFNHKLAPSHLVVPIEATLTASSPSSTSQDGIRKHKAFAQDKITIQAFADEVLVLNSLQRPRKINARGSDGKLYGLMLKPKDDLRKDQRLMEFNGLVNRALKRNTDSSKRRLYIKTYAVTPLSEASGLIEWVEGIKPIRDILLGIYGRKGIRPNYNEIKKDLDVASSAEENANVFAEKVLTQFPASLHEWFTETYAEPDAWFAARVRYARSAAVMSIAGHILGLGDRHGENILLEEGTGGVFHVDFNCLFDKGLTFEKPELVPFRLTHNMVDAMGPYGYEGPFRKSCELTMGLLRQEHDTLMTVLETFLYDPTTDFVSKKKRSTMGVPETPTEILESVATKLKGLLRGETVPLSTDGYVDALIQEATSHFRLASMYIGWCSFL